MTKFIHTNCIRFQSLPLELREVEIMGIDFSGHLQINKYFLKSIDYVPN